MKRENEILDCKIDEKKTLKTFQFKSEKNKFIIVLMLMDFRERKRVEVFIFRCPSRAKSD